MWKIGHYGKVWCTLQFENHHMRGQHAWIVVQLLLSFILSDFPSMIGALDNHSPQSKQKKFSPEFQRLFRRIDFQATHLHVLTTFLSIWCSFWKFWKIKVKKNGDFAPFSCHVLSSFKPKTNQNLTKNWQKMDQKCTKNGPKMDLKWI